MNPCRRIRKSVCSVAVWIILSVIAPWAQAQQTNSEATEVYLTFQYRGVVSNYITSYYKDDQFYLPVSELFNVLKIPHEVNQGALSITGNYLGKKKFLLDFKNQLAQSGDHEIQLQADDFMIKEIDYFVKPILFEKLFGLKFTINFNNLTLDLQTNDKMPVVAQYEREQKRKKLDRQQPLYRRSYYPLRYDRDYGIVDGVFWDYNFSGIYTNNSQLFTFSNALGAELLGGDVQGNLFGAVSDQQSTFTTSGLRWRYVQRNNPYFSNAIAGQTSTEGISNRSITGFKLSNKPVEPRLLFERYVIDGDVTPQSEVELYLNNRLVDYQKADQSGNYRFVVPLTYGSTNYSIRIYTPSGQEIDRSSRLQVPFDYLPPGQIDYSISGGRLSNPILGSTRRGYVGAASVSAGISDWLTAKVSSEYLTSYHHDLPSVTGTLNARLFSNYLVSADFNSENFYRFTSSVVYNSGASWSLSYDYNPGNSRLYNIGGYDQQARINLFTPFKLGNIPLNIRWSSTYSKAGLVDLLRYRADINTRLGRLNIRLGYQDQQAGNSLSFATTSSSRLTNSYTYSLGRYYNVPKLFRGMFIRGQMTYLPGLEKFEETELQISRNFMQTGRVQFTFGHNFIGNFNSLSLNFTIDFNKIRSNTTSRTSGSEISITQNFRGSIGYDPYGDQLLLNNRQQVGQSGTAVRLFVDNNNDGFYEDSTDQVITDPAVHLNRAGGRTTVKNGINYISQLLPYYRYDMEINKEALSNPMLVPDIENFSIVTDPNQYKTIEIPFYQSGVISGNVAKKQDSTFKALSGVRLFLESNYEKESSRKPFSKELRTFSDGSFYTYEIPPGRYHLYIDPKQLEFLDAISKPDTMDITIKSLAEGDFVENLNFTVVPNVDTTQNSQPAFSQQSHTSNEQPDEKEIADQQYYYEIQLASFKTLEKAESVASEASKHLGGSFTVTLNTNNGLYAIRSTPIPEREDALETIISYYNSNYSGAALVVLNNNYEKSTVKPEFIQLGTFSTIQQACAFARSSAKELKKELAITKNLDSGQYKVYINESYPSDQSIESQLAKIKGTIPFSDAYINHEHQIQIGAFKNLHTARTFAHNSQILLNRTLNVTKDAEEEYYKVVIDSSYTSQTTRDKTLAQVKQTAVFHDASINSSNGDSIILHKGRPMKFTYRVQVEGVTKESEDTYLSEVLDSASDTDLEQPRKETVIFDNVTTWNKTLKLQKKLAKISTVGHPIIILIEESRTEN